MTIQELKHGIETQVLSDEFLVLKCSDNSFVAHQYIKAIAEFKHKDIAFIDDIEIALNASSNIFNIVDNELKILSVDCFSTYDRQICDLKNCIVICYKVDKNCEELYQRYIVEIPKLENWQISDYIYSNLRDVPKDKLDWLINICKSDIFRLDLELQKLKLFDNPATTFQYFEDQHIFNDLSEYTVFNFSNAIVKRDKSSIIKIYNELNNIDINEMGLLTILYTNFKNIISIQMGRNVTAESLGIKQNQFNAIKWNCGKYSNAELLEIFKMLTSLDLWVKDGTLAVSDLIDYMLVKIVRR